MRRLGYILLLVALAFPAISNAGFFGFGSTPPIHNTLIDAADVGNNAYVKQLVSNGYPLNSVDGEGQTALMKAAIRGNETIAKTLVDGGANVNMQDKLGNTALHYAASHDHIAASDTLLKNGAKTDIVNKHGKTALQQALDSKSVNVAKLIDPTSLVAVESEAFMPVVAAGISGKAIAIGAGVAAAGGGAAAAAGGGGGGGGGGGSSSSSPAPAPTPNPPSSNPPASPPPSTPPAPSTPISRTITPIPTDILHNPSSYEGFEYYNTRSDYTLFNGSTPATSNGLGLIKASAAYAQGFSGSGVTVAVVDTGVDLGHPDLANNIQNNGKDFVNNDNNAQDDNGHGTHVAGIIAGVRGNTVRLDDGTNIFPTNLNMQGVAYSAKILPIKVMDSHGSGNSSDIAAGIDYATARAYNSSTNPTGVRVINLSLGGGGTTVTDPLPDISTSIAGALQNKILVFAAAGNEGGANPIWPARNASTAISTINTANPNGAMIAVVSVNSSNQISSFSNRCGDAMKWCLSAPGENIHSTYWQNGSSYGVLSGTSMATPFASGAAAILMGEFPSLTSRQVAELLLETSARIHDASATLLDPTAHVGDLKYDVNSTYGWGLIDLDKASNPVGQTIVALGNNISNGGTPLSGSGIVLSSAFGNSLQNSGLQFAILDKYDRAFTMNLSSITGSNVSHMQATDSFENFAEPVMSKIQMADIGENVSLGFGNEDSKELQQQGGVEPSATSYFSMVSDADEIKQAVNYNVPIAEYFGFGAAKNLDGSMFMGDATRGNPYLALAHDGISSVSSFAFEDNHVHTNFAMFDGKNQQSGYETSGFASEVAAEFSGIAIASQFGVINEKESFLGSHSSGAFAMGGTSTPTYFYNFSGSINIAKNTKLFGVFSEGVTKPEDAENSLISSISNIRSQSFAGGITFDENFLDDDILGFSISSPLHVTSGSASINLPYATDASGNIYRQNAALNLASSGVETDIELFYKFPVESASLSFGAMRRLQPENIQNSESEDLLLFKLINKF